MTTSKRREPGPGKLKPWLPDLAAQGFMWNTLIGLVIEEGRTIEEKEWIGWGWGLEGHSLDSSLTANSKLSKPASATHLKDL